MRQDMYGDEETNAEGRGGMNRAGTALAAIVITGLLFLCFRFALDASGGDRRAGGAPAPPGARPTAVVSGAPRAGTPARPNPGSPGGAIRPPSLSPYATGAAPAPPRQHAPLPLPQGDPVFASAEEQRAVRAYLKEMRAAYEAARTLGGGEAAPAVAGAARPLAATPDARTRALGNTGDGVVSADAVRNGDVPLDEFVPEGLPTPPAMEPARVRAQADALGVLVALNAHPALYPEALRDDVHDLAQEMRAFLATMRLAAAATDPREADAYRPAAAPRLARASTLLMRLEDVAKSGVLPAPRSARG